MALYLLLLQAVLGVSSIDANGVNTHPGRSNSAYLNECAIAAPLVKLLSEGGINDLTASNGATLYLGTSEIQLSFGMEQTTQVTLTPTKPLHQWSATKMVTAITLMKIVEDNIVNLSLDEPIGKYIEWWTQDEADPRAGVTLRHLLSQTSGFGKSPKVPKNFLGVTCETSQRVSPFSGDPTLDKEGGRMTQEECAKQLYEEAYGHLNEGMAGMFAHPDTAPSSVRPGSHWMYSESNFNLNVLVAEKVTGKRWHEVFRKYIGDPLDLSLECTYPTYTKNVDGGGDFDCPAEDLAHILSLYFSGALLSDASVAEMEGPQTLAMGAKMPADVPKAYILPSGKDAFSIGGRTASYQYGLGVWRVCFDADCSGRGLVHSIGVGGAFPWIDRRAVAASAPDGYWGLIARDAELGGIMAGKGQGATLSAVPPIMSAVHSLLEGCISERERGEL